MINLDNTPLSLQDLLGYHGKVASFFSKKWEIIAKNEQKMLADDWNERQKKNIHTKGANPISMPVTKTAINNIVSTQMQARQSWKVEASSDPNDEVGAEVATVVLRDFERKNDLAHLESDVFGKGVGVSFGADKFEVRSELGKNKITNRPVDILNLVWDINDSSYSVDKPLFIAEIEKTTAKALKADGVDIDDISTEVGDLFYGRDNLDYFGAGDGEDRTISVFHHYHLTKKTYYNVLFKDSQNLFEFRDVIIKKTRSKKEAQELLDSISVFYGMSGADPSEELSIETQDVLEYDYYKFTYNKMLEYAETGETFHPYNLYFSIKEGGDWISVTDMLAAPQLLMDRLWSQVDRSIANELKNVYEFNIHSLAEGETTESVIRKVTRDGGVIFKKTAEKALSVAESKGFNQSYLAVIDAMGSSITNMMGGANSQGLKEGASESGRAVALRQEAGRLVAALFLDNFNRYKEAKGRKLLELIKKYDTTERVIKILGGDLDEEMAMFLQQSGNLQPSMTSNNAYLTVGSGVGAFQNADLDLTIDVAPMNAYERANRLDQLTTAEKNMPILLQSPSYRAEKLKLLDIPKGVSSKIIEEMAQFEAMQMANQQQNQAQQ